MKYDKIKEGKKSIFFVPLVGSGRGSELMIHVSLMYNLCLPVRAPLELELLYEGGDLVVGLDEPLPRPPVHRRQTH